MSDLISLEKRTSSKKYTTHVSSENFQHIIDLFSVYRAVPRDASARVRASTEMAAKAGRLPGRVFS